MVPIVVVLALVIGRPAVSQREDWSINGPTAVSQSTNPTKYSVKSADGGRPEQVTWTIPDGVISHPKADKHGQVDLDGSTDLILKFPEVKGTKTHNLVAKVGDAAALELPVTQFQPGGKPFLYRGDRPLERVDLESGAPESMRLTCKLRVGKDAVDGRVRVTLPTGLAFSGKDKGDGLSRDFAAGAEFEVEASASAGGTIEIASLVEPDPTTAEVPVYVVPYADKIEIEGLDSGSTVRTGASVTLSAKVTAKGSAVAGRSIKWGFGRSNGTTSDTIVQSIETASLDSTHGDSVKLSASKPGRCVLYVYLINGDGSVREDVNSSVIVEVAEAPQLAGVELPSTRMVIGQEMRARFRALASKQDGQIPFKKMSVQISLKDGNDVIATRPDDTEPTGSSVVLVARTVGSGTYTFKVKVDDANEVSGEFAIDVVAIADFSKIKVTLDPMDPADVKRTFGALIERDYWVMTCHVVNKLDALENGQKVEAILVYGGSLDTAVEFEKRPTSDKKAPWVPVKFEDVVRDFTPAHENDENRVPDDARGELLKVRETRIGIDPQAIGISAEKIAPVYIRVGEVVRIRIPETGVDVQTIDVSTDALYDGRVDFLKDDMLVVGKQPGLVALRAKMTRAGKPFTVVQLFRVVPVDGQKFAMHPSHEDAEANAITVVSGTSLSLDAGEAPDNFEWTTSHERQVTINPKAGSIVVTGTGRYRIMATSKSDPEKRSYFVVQSETPPSRPNLPTSTYVDSDGKLKQIRTRFRYKPVSMEMMLLAQDGREFETSEAGLRRTISVAQLILTALTGSNILTGRGLELAVAGAGLMPAIADITVPNLAEKHRSAILTQGLRSLEEVPFGAELRRVVFYPKGEFGNLVPKHRTRIATVDTSEFSVSVAVIQRVGTKREGNGNGGPPKKQ